MVDAESPWELPSLRREMVKEFVPPGMPRGRQDAVNGIISRVAFCPCIAGEEVVKGEIGEYYVGNVVKPLA